MILAALKGEKTLAELYERSRVHVSRLSAGNQESYTGADHEPIDGYYYLTVSPADIHVTVACGPGKHSAFIPSFGGTATVTTRIGGH